MADIHVADDGTVTVDGKVITPQEIESTGDKAVADAEKAWAILTNHANWNYKQLEKGILYISGIAAATNGFGQIPMPASVRGLVTLGAAIALGAIHVSTPKT